MLKKRICESKSLGLLKSDSARLLYTWLIPWLDIKGRHSADPDLIKGHIFPKIKSMTIKKIVALVNDLVDNNLIILYQINGEYYLQYVQFTEHQVLNPNREATTKIPDPPENSGELRITLDNSNTSKVKGSKVKFKESLSKVKEINPSCPKSEPSDVDITLVQLLIDKMAENNPNSSILKNLTEKRQADWINSCRLMRERDNRTAQEIEAIIGFSQKDQFWKANILSMPKLREKFDQLWMKAGKSNYSGIREWLKEQEKKHE